MKLEGIKVVDLSQFLPGPHLSMMMADHGAEVIAIEAPGGAPVRELGLRKNGHSVWFRNISRGKQSLCLNLKDPQAKVAFLKLCETADVVIEAYRPGVVDRLGVGYEAIKAVNPSIVYCSIAAYGQTGPKKFKPAHDLSIQADSGLLSVNLGNDDEPAMPNIPSADMASSLMALSGILMALLRREKTGEGDYLDMSMQDALVAWAPNVMGPVFAEQRSPIPKNERTWGGAAMYRIYRTKDNKHLTLGGSELKFTRNLLSALEREDLFEYCSGQPGTVQDPVRAFFREVFATKTLSEWDEWFVDKDVCYAPVRDLYSGIHEDHLKARDMLLIDDQGNEHLGVPIKFSQEPAQPCFELASIGQQNKQILQGLGYSDTEIKTMQDSGALG